MSRFVSVFAAGVAACAFVFGCSADTTAGDKPTCVSGASQACSCTDGAEGAQQCNAAGEYDACVCESGDTGVDVTSTDTGEDTTDTGDDTTDTTDTTDTPDTTDTGEDTTDTGVCVPQCDGKACGPDGCDGSCGDCPDNGTACTRSGQCEEPVCVPQCEGKVCGPDGCDGSCGDCADDLICDVDSGQCQQPPCEPQCAGKECGPDACGGECGFCPAVAPNCDPDGLCQLACTPDCGGKSCGSDGCGGSCGVCEGELVCNDGACGPPCVPQCEGLVCGPDGCGGECGACESGSVCSDGVCEVCNADCDGKTCGADGCGGSCGACTDDEVCSADFECTALCNAGCAGGKTCGPDGCGGVCGTCPGDLACNSDGFCFDPDFCEPLCAEGAECGPNGCGGTCGNCPGGQFCTPESTCTTECTPACQGKACGDDGCGGSCGECAGGIPCTVGGQCGNACTSCDFQPECSEVGFESGNLFGWETAGSIAVVENLGVATPTEGSYMLFMGTGTAGLPPGNGELSLPNCLPEGSYAVTFDWKFYSEEFLEYCGSQYQDGLRVEIVTKEGAQEVLSVSIDDMCGAENGSCDADKCGSLGVLLSPADVGFDQNGVYTTPWLEGAGGFTLEGETNFDIKLSVFDAGDSAYDSVALIDNVKIEACTPQCDGKECGPNGCGGTCGSCEGSYDCLVPTCNAEGACVGDPKPQGEACTSDDNVCTLDECDGEGNCIYLPGNEGVACEADGNLCTVDQCDFAGVCVHEPGPEGVACAGDGNFCTIDECDAAGVCIHTPGSPGEPCPSDGNACTLDECNGNGECLHIATEAGTECESDGNVCTENVCDGVGSCTHPNVIIGTECTSDSLECTTDACNGEGVCEHLPVAAKTACTADEDPCTLDECDGAGLCAHDPASDGTECDDGDPCTSEACTAGECLVTATDPACCTENATCDDELPCTSNLCNLDTNTCDFPDIPGLICCGADADCDDMDEVCTTDSCVDGLCKYVYADIEGCCQPVLWVETFDDYQGDWTVQDNGTGCTWDVKTDGEALSSPGAMKWGDPATGTYECGDNFGAVQSPSIALPSGGPPLGLKLSIWHQLGDQGSNTYDQIFIEVIDVESGDVTELAQKPDLGPAQTWNTFDYDLGAFGGKTIQIQVRFDSIDALYNAAPGVYIDDVKITQLCEL